MQKLLLRTRMARLNGTIYKFLERLSKTDLLILDDFGLPHLEQQQRLDLMEIMEDRHAQASTIITGQPSVAVLININLQVPYRHGSKVDC